MRVVPNYIYMKGNNIQYPLMVGTQNIISNQINKLTNDCGC